MITQNNVDETGNIFFGHTMRAARFYLTRRVQFRLVFSTRSIFNNITHVIPKIIVRNILYYVMFHTRVQERIREMTRPRPWFPCT